MALADLLCQRLTLFNPDIKVDMDFARRLAKLLADDDEFALFAEVAKDVTWIKLTCGKVTRLFAAWYPAVEVFGYISDEVAAMVRRSYLGQPLCMSHEEAMVYRLQLKFPDVPFDEKFTRKMRETMKSSVCWIKGERYGSVVLFTIMEYTKEIAFASWEFKSKQLEYIDEMWASLPLPKDPKPVETSSRGNKLTKVSFWLELERIQHDHPQIKFDDKFLKVLDKMEGPIDEIALEAVPGPAEGAVTIRFSTHGEHQTIAIWDPLRKKLIYPEEPTSSSSKPRLEYIEPLDPSERIRHREYIEKLAKELDADIEVVEPAAWGRAWSMAYDLSAQYPEIPVNREFCNRLDKLLTDPQAEYKLVADTHPNIDFAVIKLVDEDDNAIPFAAWNPGRRDFSYM